MSPRRPSPRSLSLYLDDDRCDTEYETVQVHTYIYPVPDRVFGDARFWILEFGNGRPACQPKQLGNGSSNVGYVISVPGAIGSWTEASMSKYEPARSVILQAEAKGTSVYVHE